MCNSNGLLAVETHSFYESLERIPSGRKTYDEQDRREFLTSYTQFMYKNDGTFDMIRRNYEGQI